MTTAAADTYAVHAALARDATPRRFARWVAAEGETPAGPVAESLPWLEEHRMGPALRRELLHPDGTAVDVVRTVFHRARFTRKKLDVARQIFAETGMPYPVEVEALLGELTETFNRTDDAAILADLRHRVVVACKSPEQGVALADELELAIDRVRAKDRVAANLALLAEALDAAIGAEERRHQRLVFPTPATEDLVWTAMRAWSNGQLREHLASPGVDRVRLGDAIDAGKDDDLEELLAAYFAEAERTREVAEMI